MLEQMEAFLSYLQAERAASPHTLKNYASDLQQFRSFLRKNGLAHAKPVLSLTEGSNEGIPGNRPSTWLRSMS